MTEYLGMLVDRDNQTFRVVGQDVNAERICLLRGLVTRQLIGLYKDDVIRNAYKASAQKVAA